MNESAFHQLEEIIQDALFPEIDLALRAGRHIDRDDGDFLGQFDVHRIGSFHHRDARIVSQLPIEHAVAGVHGIHFFGSALQQAIGESAGAATQVGTDAVGDIHTKCGQRVIEFLPGAGNECHVDHRNAGSIES